MARRSNRTRGSKDDDREDDLEYGRNEPWHSTSLATLPAVSANAFNRPLADESNEVRDDEASNADLMTWRLSGPEHLQAGTPAVFQIDRTGEAIPPGERVVLRLQTRVSGDASLESPLFEQIAAQLAQPDAPPGIRMAGRRLIFDDTAPSEFAFSVLVNDDPSQNGEGVFDLRIARASDGIVQDAALRARISTEPPADPQDLYVPPVPESPIRLSIVDAEPVQEGDSGDKGRFLRFYVERTNEPSNPAFAESEVFVNFETFLRASPSTIPPATPGVDYIATSGTLRFRAGEVRIAIDVALVGDNLPEDDELVDIRIGNIVGPRGSEIVDSTAVGLILNDDESPFTPSLFSVFDASDVVEGDPGDPGESLVYRIIRDGTGNYADTSASVSFLTFFDIFGNGTQATPDVDYASTSGQLVFSAGQTERFVTVDVLEDNLTEPEEHVAFQITNAVGPPGTTIVNSAADGIILDDETVGPSHFSVYDAPPVLEGDPGDATQLVFEVVRDGIGGYSDASVTVGFQTWNDPFPNGTSAQPGVDYITTSGTLSFAAGETVGWVTVAILEDTVIEGDEIVSFRLFNPSGPPGTDIDQAEATGEIFDDDAPFSPSTFRIANAAPVEEGDPGNAGSMTFVVSREGSGNFSNAPASVRFRTIDSTGGLPSTTEGEDYLGTAGLLEFAPGETARIVTVQLVGDTILEPTEQLTVELHNAAGPGGTTIGDSRGTGQVIDDDLDQVSASHFRIMDSAWTLENDPFQGTESLQFDIIREGTGNFADAEAVLELETFGRIIPFLYPPATAGEDFVDYDGLFDFAAGVTQRTLYIPIVGDNLEEENEGVGVRLLGIVSAAPGSTIVEDEGVGVIVDDDTPITLPSVIQISDAPAVVEGDPGDPERVMTFEITRTGIGSAIAAEVTVDFFTTEPFPPPPRRCSACWAPKRCWKAIRAILQRPWCST